MGFVGRKAPAKISALLAVPSASFQGETSGTGTASARQPACPGRWRGDPPFILDWMFNCGARMAADMRVSAALLRPDGRPKV